MVEEVFRTQRIEHAFLEPEATLAVPDRDAGTMHVYSGGQGVWDDRNQIASVLDVDRSRIIVELVSNGGAFGGKEDMANRPSRARGLAPPAPGRVLAGGEPAPAPKRHPIEMATGSGATPTDASPPCTPA